MFIKDLVPQRQTSCAPKFKLYSPLQKYILISNNAMNTSSYKATERRLICSALQRHGYFRNNVKEVVSNENPQAISQNLVGLLCGRSLHRIDKPPHDASFALQNTSGVASACHCPFKVCATDGRCFFVLYLVRTCSLQVKDTYCQ